MDEKSQQNLGTSLAGKILITPPGSEDKRFHNALTLVIEHSFRGAIGIIINRPTLTPLDELLPDWKNAAAEPGVIFAGGPIDHDTLIAVGKSNIDQGELVLGAHPVDLDEQPELVPEIDEIRVFSGYVLWGIGQLEEEINQNFWWLTDNASLDDLFTRDPHNLWNKILSSQGDPLRWYANYPLEVSLN